MKPSSESEFESEAHDDRLLQELKDALAAASVPPGSAEAARELFTWRLIDQDLATLAVCFDSAVDEGVLVRGPATLAPRLLSFESDDLGLEVEIGTDQIIGQLLPPSHGVIFLRTAGGACRRTTADLTGKFVFDRLLSGPQRFECELGAETLVTEWTMF